MKILQSDELSKNIGSIIHQDTQQHGNHFDLTVSKIHKLAEAGSLDFGGSEFQPAKKQAIKPQKNEGDDYGWWHLPEGTYQATLNEKIVTLENVTAILAPHPHTQQVGIIANTCILSEEDEQAVTITFQVPKAGCNIKENARFAVLYLISN